MLVPTVSALYAQRCWQLQLQGSVWKGQKVRIAEARPNYKQRIHIEKISSETDTVAACTPDEDKRQDDEAYEQPSRVSYRIRSPHGQVWTLPCSGTGSKKSLFVPVRQRSMEDWLCQDLNTHRSSLYRVNSTWEQMLDAQARRPAVDPELFASTAVLPVSMVRLNNRAFNW